MKKQALLAAVVVGYMIVRTAAGQTAAPVASPSAAASAKPALAASPPPKAKAPKPQTQLPTETKASKLPKAAAGLPPLLQEVEAKYTEAKTLFAKFTQVNHLVSTGHDKKSAGVIAVKRPNKVRWETLEPDPNILVGNGKKFWFYTPPFDESEHGQVLERKSSQVQSQVAQALLSGSFSVAKGMKVEQLSPTRFMLNFKKGSAGTVQAARIEIDPAKKLIQKVTLQNEGGNTSEITLSEIQLGKELEDAMFNFVPPANTDHVKE